MTTAHTRKDQSSLFGGSESEVEIFQRIFSPFWVDYPVGKIVLKRFRQIYMQPKTHRPQCCLLIGEPAAGKTTLAKHFLRTINPADKPKDEAFVRRVHTMTKGSVGETWRLVCRLIYHAKTVSNGKFTMDLLDKVDGTIPTLRRRLAT